MQKPRKRGDDKRKLHPTAAEEENDSEEGGKKNSFAIIVSIVGPYHTSRKD